MTLRKIVSATLVASFLSGLPITANTQGAEAAQEVTGQYKLTENERRAADSLEDMQKVISSYEALTAQGHALSAYRLAVIYRGGFFVEADASKAIEYYRKSADLGRVDSLSNLGEMLLREGHGDEAYEVIERAREAGASGYEVIWAKAHMRGDFGEKSDPALGFAELQRLNAEGDRQATITLADAYRYGWGVHEDDLKSFNMYQALAKDGDTLAMERLAFYYRNGYGVDQDLNQALDLYQQAVDSGRDSALLGMARTQVRMNRGSQALETYQKALDVRLDEAALEIAVGHINRDFGQATNQQSGIDALRDGAYSGDIKYNIAALDVLADGRRLQLEVDKVVATVEQAADAGDQSAAAVLIRFARKKPGLLGKAWVKRQEYLEKYAGILTDRTLATEKVWLAVDSNSPRMVGPILSEMLENFNGDAYRYGFQRVFWLDKNAFTYLMQEKLNERGFYDGPVNGYLTKDTVRAMLHFCNQSGIYDECVLGPMRGSAMRMMIDALTDDSPENG